MNKPTYIDLFAGAGGLSEGFIRAGFFPVAHIEMCENACNTIKTRLAFHHLKSNNNLVKYNKFLKNEISRDVLWSSISNEIIESVLNVEITPERINTIFAQLDRQLDSKKVDIIIGGPPCQAYSVVGRSRDPNRMNGDKRNYLFKMYGKFLERYKPEYFVFENVLGLLSAGKSKYLIEMFKLFNEIGYSVEYKVFNALDFGVLQNRKRVIIMGRRGKAKFTLPKIHNSPYNGQTLLDLFKDLPSLKPGQEFPFTEYSNSGSQYLYKYEIRNIDNVLTQHITRNHNLNDLEIYSLAIEKWLNGKVRLQYTDIPLRLQKHKNTVTFLDRFKVVDPFGPSHTLVAHISKDGHYYIYPDPQQVRSISVREAARIQSFPDDYFFEGGRTAAFRQIGNAVPPLMARNIASVIKRLL